MKYIQRYNESRTIKATDRTIREIVSNEIDKLGIKCDLNHIDVSEVTSTSELFKDSPFNGNTSLWNVQNVTNMTGMFECSSFNGDISLWDVKNVTDMSGMFFNSKFNGHISNWNVQNVTNMIGMFSGSSFNRDISNWNVKNVQNMYHMFLCSTLYRREPWWYVLSPLFGSNSLMWDSLDFKWIDIEGKIIYRDKLSKILLRTYNTKWNEKLPPVFGFTYQ